MGIGVSRASGAAPLPRDVVRALKATDFGSTVAAGSDFSLAVSESGDIVAAGQEALSWPAEARSKGGGIVSIAAGGAHALLLQEAGTVVAVGSNEEGQGEVPCLEAKGSSSSYNRANDHSYGESQTANTNNNNNNNNKNTSNSNTSDGDSSNAPGVPQPPIQYTSVGAGVAFSAFLRSDGEVHFTGLAGNGRGDAPPLPEGTSYVRASLGSSHALLLRSDGVAVACGNNKQGQCNIPPLTDGLFYVGIAAGDYHSLLLRCDGEVVAFGSEHMGKCEAPRLPEGHYYVDVAAGGGHSIFVRSDGAVFLAGEGDFGQLSAPALTEGTRYIAAAAGSNHSLLLRSDGRLVAFGDNRRGQCDLPSDARAKRPPVLPEVSVTLGVQPSDSGGDQGLACTVDGMEVEQLKADIDRIPVGALRKQLAKQLGCAVWRLQMLLEGDGSFSFSPPIAIPLEHDAKTLGDVLKGLN